MNRKDNVVHNLTAPVVKNLKLVLSHLVPGNPFGDPAPKTMQLKT